MLVGCAFGCNEMLHMVLVTTDGLQPPTSDCIRFGALSLSYVVKNLGVQSAYTLQNRTSWGKTDRGQDQYRVICITSRRAVTLHFELTAYAVFVGKVGLEPTCSGFWIPKNPSRLAKPSRVLPQSKHTC